MKLSLMLAGFGLAVAVVPGAASAQPWQSINQRQAQLDQRIDQGVRSGNLTRNEAQRLRGEFRALANLEYRYRRSGNGLSMGERSDLNQRFNRLATKIRVQKRDWQRR